MTDREVLLIAYGALKVNGANGVQEILEEHLFADKKELSQKVRIGDTVNIRIPEICKTPEAAKALADLSADMRAVASCEPLPERKPNLAPPGSPEYKLKRDSLGLRGTRLIELYPKKLKSKIAEYRNAGQAIHPGTLDDIESAEIYLKSLETSQEYRERG